MALGSADRRRYRWSRSRRPRADAPGTPGAGRATAAASQKDGEPLTLVLGVAANDPTSVAVANTAADQLRNVGITASVSALDPVALYGDALANNRVDAVVGWHQAGGDLATALASRYGCPALEATPVSTGTDDVAAVDRRRDHAATTSAPPRPTDHRAPRPRRPTPRRRKTASWSRRRATSPASATAASSRRSMRHSTAPRTSAT